MCKSVTPISFLFQISDICDKLFNVWCDTDQFYVVGMIILKPQVLNFMIIVLYFLL